MSTASKVALAAAVVLLGGAAGLLQRYVGSPVAKVAHEHQMQRTELYFGAIATPQWQQFLAQEVTPRFPDGLSWYDVNGQWRGPSGQPEKLPSRIVLLIHADNPGNRQALADIGRLFKQRFGLAVLQVSSVVQASDPDWTEARVEGNQQLQPTP
ncbi:hypothetical protein ACVW0Y_002268 [Pseudomonas sp. TE3786]